MTMTDPVADMLTRIRNAVAVFKEKANVPASGIKRGIAEVLKREGFIKDFEVVPDSKQGFIKIELKYGPDSEKVITKIVRKSKPGCRMYKKVGEVEKVIGGTGIGIYSTCKGVLSDRECRRENVGGEYLCIVY